MALTNESITASFGNGETVEIANAEDYNTFITYLNSNPTSQTMRNAEITENIDFENTDMTMYASIEANNITIDGKGHRLKNIVKKNISTDRIFFAGAYSDNSVIKNVTFSNCYIENRSDMFLFRLGCLENVKIEKSRFISGNTMYITYTAKNVSYLSVSATFLVNSNYYGVDCYTTDHTSCVNDVIYLGSSSSIDARSFNISGQSSFIYTRDRFTNYNVISGIVTNGGLCSMAYAAIVPNTAQRRYPFGGRRNHISCYYDNTLIPDAADWTDLGVSAQILQSIAEMTARGWFVKAVQ